MHLPVADVQTPRAEKLSAIPDIVLLQSCWLIQPALPIILLQVPCWTATPIDTRALRLPAPIVTSLLPGKQGIRRVVAEVTFALWLFSLRKSIITEDLIHFGYMPAVHGEKILSQRGYCCSKQQRC